MLLDHREQQVLLAQQVLLVLLVHKVVKEFRVQQDRPGFKDQPAQQVQPVLLGCKVHRELSVLLALQDPQVQLVLQVRQDQLV